MEEDIILQVEALSSQMIDDIKKIVRCPSVEGEALPCLLYTSRYDACH